MKKVTDVKKLFILVGMFSLGINLTHAKARTEIVKIKSNIWELTESTDAYLIPTNKGKISIYIYGLDKRSEENLSNAKKNSCIAITQFDNKDDVKILNVKCK